MCFKGYYLCCFTFFPLVFQLFFPPCFCPLRRENRPNLACLRGSHQCVFNAESQQRTRGEKQREQRRREGHGWKYVLLFCIFLLFFFFLFFTNLLILGGENKSSYEGYLSKGGKNLLEKYPKRYFRVLSSSLFWYKSKEDTTPLGEMLLSDSMFFIFIFFFHYLVITHHTYYILLLFLMFYAFYAFFAFHNCLCVGCNVSYLLFIFISQIYSRDRSTFLYFYISSILFHDSNVLLYHLLIKYVYFTYTQSHELLCWIHPLFSNCFVSHTTFQSFTLFILVFFILVNYFSYFFIFLLFILVIHFLTSLAVTEIIVKLKNKDGIPFDVFSFSPLVASPSSFILFFLSYI